MNMKTIAVILPVNNPEMITSKDLESFQTKEHYFELHYLDTHLREIKSVNDANAVLDLTLKKIQEVAAKGAAAVIVYAFGDLGIKEGKALVNIPVMGLGKSAIHMASILCRKHYTVIPAMLAHNGFINDMMREENLGAKYIEATHSPELTPAEIRQDSQLLEKLITTASLEITEKDIDTFTMGCGCFIGVAKKLQDALSKKHKRPIMVVDPMEVPLNLIKSLI